MSLKAVIARWLAARRSRQIHRLAADPRTHQLALLRQLLTTARGTAFGSEHRFTDVLAAPDVLAAYQQAVPVRDYEALRPWAERAANGNPDVLWPGKPLYLAITSGTTSGKKYIPLTRPSMQCQVKGAKDALLLYIHRTGDASFLDGKMMFLSGSPALETNAAGMSVGRLSGISQHFVPAYLQRNRVPTYATNCIDDWEQKVQAIVQETATQDLRLISGIPPWVRMFFEAATAATGKTPAQLWPNLKVYVEGGVDYGPYRTAMEQAMGRTPEIVEVFPASEGFVAVQDGTFGEGLLVGLDYGIFFEFIPLEEYGKPNARRLPLWEVQLNQQYVLVLSTNAGLWAYDIGDTVRFVSTSPYRLKVTGRAKHFLSAFGEHVIEEEVNAVLNRTCAAYDAQAAECTVAPFIPTEPGQAGYHEWFIEFDTPPTDLPGFAHYLDAEMCLKNAYYDDLRAGGMLLPARITLLKPGASRAYMESIGKLGGQNKFPRLKNDRSTADALAPWFA